MVLDEHVPSDHMLRSIDRHLDLDDVRQALKPFYSSTGRPSIDPELMIRMLIVGYCMGIRSERRLCEEIHLNLAYRWFCGLGLDGKVPDHSTFSKNRHGRFRESDVLRYAGELEFGTENLLSRVLNNLASIAIHGRGMPAVAAGKYLLSCRGGYREHSVFGVEPTAEGVANLMACGVDDPASVRARILGRIANLNPAEPSICEADKRKPEPNG
jgi:hypothetical protein